MSFKVYKHTFNDGRAYIGFTVNPQRRWRYGHGYREQPDFFNEIMRQGWNNMSHEILEEVETETEARQREQYYIELYETYKPNKGFNKCGKNKVREGRVVKCVETGEIFYSCREAGASVGRTAAAISYAILHNKPCAKFHWQYENWLFSKN